MNGYPCLNYPEAAFGALCTALCTRTPIKTATQFCTIVLLVQCVARSAIVLLSSGFAFVKMHRIVLCSVTFTMRVLGVYNYLIYIPYTASSSYNNFALLTALNSEDLGYAVSNQLGGTNVQALMKLHNFYMSCMSSNTSNIQFSLTNFFIKNRSVTAQVCFICSLMCYAC